MARRSTAAKPNHALRTLLAVLAVTAALAGLLVGVHLGGTASLAPKLGLDLEGGTQLVLTPRVVGDQRVTAEQVSQARDIISERVDSQGVSGAEVTTQGANNIVVSMPGDPTRQQEENLRRSSALQFRPVLDVQQGSPPPAAPSATANPSGSASKSGSATTSGSATSSGSASSSASASDSATSTGTSTSASRSRERSAIPAAESASGSASTTGGTSSGSATKSTKSSSATASASATPAAKPTSPTDPAWATTDVVAAFTKLNCSDPEALRNLVDDPTTPLVTCSSEGDAKYLLGPVAVGGQDITDAVAGYVPGPNGQPTPEVEIRLSFSSKATKVYGDLSKEMISLPSPRNQLATVLDSRVLIAPTFNAVIPNGRASITGGFTFDSATELAKQLKFGALPLSFDLQTRSQISPTLGEEQLRLGLLAGLVGLGLVVLYSIVQYRALALVTVGSIVIAAILTYLTITLLGWAQNYRLDMAGVTGLIVAIGVTADSFIVYFERIRDEVRDGRTLRTAVDTGWARAKRTILIADGVNFLGAAVLYLLASSSVRGFAFTLGLTTLIDILVVYFFTHPLVSLLAGRHFFASGHRWSGVDPERLGVTTSSRYAGRGRFTTPRPAASGEGSRA
ncbi:MAG: protein translocase subunit SecD [Tetrasphaera sp.]